MSFSFSSSLGPGTFSTSSGQNNFPSYPSPHYFCLGLSIPTPVWNLRGLLRRLLRLQSMTVPYSPVTNPPRYTIVLSSSRNPLRESASLESEPFLRRFLRRLLLLQRSLLRYFNLFFPFTLTVTLPVLNHFLYLPTSFPLFLPYLLGSESKWFLGRFLVDIVRS